MSETTTMAAPAARLLRGARYSAAQAARIAWYVGHYAAVRRISGPVGRVGHPPKPYRSRPVDRGALAAAFRDLMREDLADVAAGVHPMPEELRAAPGPAALLRRSREFLADSRAVARRKQSRGHSEVLTADTEEERRGAYPRYYLQNFHYQTDGWLSAASARRYDMQVETLFTGAAGAMRRRAIPMLAEAMAGRDPRALRHLDVACGAGTFLLDLRAAFPGLSLAGLDLSPAYLAEARRRLAGKRGVSFLHANAEEIPAEDGAFDLATAVYLFHELPPPVRPRVAKEIARVLAPGGTFVFVDSLQYGDDPRFDVLLEAFPREFHEPYFDGYCREDLAATFAAAGFEPVSARTAFLSKVTAWRKAAL